MAYRLNGVECDTFEELQRLLGSARTISAVVKETREKKKDKERACKGCGLTTCAAPYCGNRGRSEG